MIREKFPDKVTLAIGDGANDISMIKMAHVGVKIVTRKTLRAGISSEYTIAKFKFLKNLLFDHGSKVYNLAESITCYDLHKSMMCLLLQIVNILVLKGAFDDTITLQVLCLSCINGVFFIWDAGNFERPQKYLIEDTDLLGTNVFWQKPS